MLSSETLDGLGDRLKHLNLIWVLGSGLDLGSYSSFLGKIRYIILREVFVREMNDSFKRTMGDLTQIAHAACLTCRFPASMEQAERIIESMMWSTGKKFASFSFEDDYFDETQSAWLKHRFQYFEIDKESSNLENGEDEIYKLSIDALQVVISFREFETELDVSIEQMIAEMMIKRGNLREARSWLDALDVKVRKLIQEEKEHRKQLKRDPRKAIYEQNRRWNKNLEEIEQQFSEERQGYVRMVNSVEKIENIKDPEKKKGVNRLMQRIHRTSRLHDFLAKLVIGNIRTDFEYRSKFFSTMFWSLPRKTFKETLWNQAKELGFLHPDALYYIANSIFSPKKPFLFPLEWIVMEQYPKRSEVDFDKEDPNRTAITPMSIDWDAIIELWKPLMGHLVEFGEISTNLYEWADADELEGWLQCREAFDVWILFNMDEGRTFQFTDEAFHQEESDFKIVFLRKLMGKYPEFDVLRNKIFTTYADDKECLLIQDKIEVTPITIRIS